MTSKTTAKLPKLTTPFDKKLTPALTFADVQQMARDAIVAENPDASSEEVEEAVGEKRDFLLWDKTHVGFAIRFYKGGTRTYLARRRIKGLKRQREITVGDVKAMKLEDASLTAQNHLRQMRCGEDPVAKQALTEEEKEARDVTLKQVFELYKTANQKKPNRGPRRPATIEDMDYNLRHYLKPFLDAPIAGITKKDCRDLFLKVSKSAPIQANKAMIYLRVLINFARDWYQLGDGKFSILEINPVALMLKSNSLNPKGARRGRIHKTQTRAVWQAMKQRGQVGATPDIRCAADWVRFRMMTGTRIEESRTLRYSYINWEDNYIEIPITKNHHPLWISMAPQMRELMEHRRALYVAQNPGQEVQPDAYVFPSESSASGHITSARVALKRIAGKNVAEYDIRRTFEDVATECRIDPDVRRMMLNHVNFDVHLQHYGYNPEATIEPMNQIAAWLDTPAPIEASPSAAACTAELEGTRAWRSLGVRELDKLVWTLPATKIATVFDVTDNCINKRCKVLGIMRPPRGYWQKLEVGKVCEWPSAETALAGTAENGRAEDSAAPQGADDGSLVTLDPCEPCHTC